jgi:hypothetical protein
MKIYITYVISTMLWLLALTLPSNLMILKLIIGIPSGLVFGYLLIPTYIKLRKLINNFMNN